MADNQKSTQVQHPWHATVRSAFQFIMGLLVIVPVVIAELGLSKSIPWVAGALAVAAAATRLMALEPVVAFLERWAPWLAPSGKNGNSQ